MVRQLHHIVRVLTTDTVIMTDHGLTPELLQYIKLSATNTDQLDLKLI